MWWTHSFQNYFTHCHDVNSISVSTKVRKNQLLFLYWQNNIHDQQSRNDHNENLPKEFQNKTENGSCHSPYHVPHSVKQIVRLFVIKIRSQPSCEGSHTFEKWADNRWMREIDVIFAESRIIYHDKIRIVIWCVVNEAGSFIPPYSLYCGFRHAITLTVSRRKRSLAYRVTFSGILNKLFYFFCHGLKNVVLLIIRATRQKVRKIFEKFFWPFQIRGLL